MATLVLALLMILPFVVICGLGLLLLAVINRALTVRRYPWAKRKPWGVMPRQSQTILLEALPASAFQQALGALQQARMKVTARSPDRMTLRAESPMSLRSFGETVTVSIEPAGGASRLTVASQPAIQGTLLDYGKGAENVERIVNLIQKSLPAS